MRYPEKYQIIVVGGGHAGVEAAAVAARMGMKTLLLTHNIETIGVMSCNPAIGGIGKGHLVKEIDALDGIMPKATDKAGIQWRTLNSRKGAAVRATRAQADRQLYRSAVREFIEAQENLQIFQASVTDVILQGEKIIGVKTQADIDFYADCIILTAGTFLAGLIHIGTNNYSGGRAGDPAANDLAKNLRGSALPVGRLKTGTPPRIDARSVDFSRLQVQPGDNPTPYFSYLRLPHPQQISCFIAHTNEKTHEIIRKNIHLSAMYSGNIEGIGPRYCPSIEDKITRFADKESHQIFIEPESLSTYELYPNGLSTSLPFSAQLDYIRSLDGFANAQITRAGYAIEYDYFNPQALQYSLESKIIENLFLAGQINGTTGYEEAAAQGLLAGINAALKVQGKSAWYPKRESAYLGVMVDDLITQGTNEPYRMFTSRAEYRLLLREDNADQRLTEIGFQLGCVSQARYDYFLRKQEALHSEQNRLKILLIKGERFGLKHNIQAAELLKRPEISYRDLQALPEFAGPDLDNEIIEQIDISATYDGYIKRQEDEIEKLQQARKQALPRDFDYSRIGSLSAELLEKLKKVQPESIEQAQRIQGMTPAAISAILIHLKKHNL